LLVGLPVALTLAWYHGDRGQQRVTRIELAILALLFLLGGGLFWRFQHAPERTSTASTGPSPSTATAQARYAAAFPELSVSETLRIDGSNYMSAIDLALVLQRLDKAERAATLLDASEQTIRSFPRLTFNGFGIADAQIHALRGDMAKAFAALREAERTGWRGPLWRYYRDIDPNLDSIRNEPEFKAVFADIERDMDRQRAELAARPKDAPLPLASAGR
jgi:hypothetical protein